MQENSNMNDEAKKLSQELHSLADPEIAEHSKRFFKTSTGEYAEGDEFLGLRVPDQRKLARKYADMPLEGAEKLLHSPYHEERLTALFILEHTFKKANAELQSEIYSLYLTNLNRINNWDLIDSSAPKILGEYLQDKPRNILYSLAASESLWDRRISIMATFPFIKKGDFDDTLHIAKLLLNDNHDLIHKACGWMLREVGKKNQKLLEEFLKSCYQKMPRTMLRYAIEKFPEDLRQTYLKGAVEST